MSFNYNSLLTDDGNTSGTSGILIGSLVGAGSLGLLIATMIAVIITLKQKVLKRKLPY